MLQQMIDKFGATIFGGDAYRYWQYKRAKKISRRYGYEIYKSHLIWMKDPEYLAILEEVTQRNITGIPNDRCYTLVEFCRQIKDVPGNIAECGSRFGKSSLFILNSFGCESDKKMHIFDSFEGISKPNQRDLDTAGKTVWESGELAVAEEVLHKNLQDFKGRFTTYKGWIPKRFQEIEDERFCFVHIDVDLYDPTRDSVEFFYPRLNKGAIIMCDDYGSGYCPGAKSAFDEFFTDKPEKVMSLSTGQCVVIKT
jgi:O-methyltransferase